MALKAIAINCVVKAPGDATPSTCHHTTSVLRGHNVATSQTIRATVPGSRS